MPAERRAMIELPGARTGVRRLGAGAPLLLHNGYLATKDDWSTRPCDLDRNRGIRLGWREPADREPPCLRVSAS